ncbi:hypothetical protein Bca4012_098457 [Brassica carinata]|uniref:Cellulose synthase (UDP-forming) n=1 Tax=Brassica carinata TaxID=52824 RepID=A0A8X7PFR4_BRACI|nr:hypothetical protein Bca52824_081127 [Brassica carinata]
MSKSYRFIPVHEGDLEPLFVTRKRTGGVIAFRVFAASVFGCICWIWFYRAIAPNQLLQSVRWNPFWRFTFADTLSQRYGNDLPRLDVFVCTADPVIEPPSMVVNTVLSVLALDYPPEKLAVYLSDDGGSHQLTFYALSRKQLKVRRGAEISNCLLLRVSSKISGGTFILNLDWDMYSNNSKSARDALCILLDEKEGKDIAFVQFPQFYDNLTRNGSMMSVVVAHVEFNGLDGKGGPFYIGTEEESEDILEPEMIKALASCTHEKRVFVCFNGQMGVKYGCPVEDIIIGLSIQCRGWKSAYLTPKKKAFLGVAPTNLHQMLGQQRRDEYSPVLFGQGKIGLGLIVGYCCYGLWAPSSVSSWWFILFGYVAAAANAYSLAVFLWCEKKYT